MKRVFGRVEAAFDILYLAAAAAALGAALLLFAEGNAPRAMAGAMALVLAGGDAFHLLPRVSAAVTGREEELRWALGTGKQIASVTMTVFYVLLWHVGAFVFQPGNKLAWALVIYGLAAVRVFLCLLPQNRWRERFPPVFWGAVRNIPFFLLGAAVSALFFIHRGARPGLGQMWLAIALSFGFYLPVVLWANKAPKIGMLMLPKTCAYVWMLAMCLSL